MSEYSFIPEGYHSVTPSLVSKNADASIKFYEAAFDAVETLRLADESTTDQFWGDRMASVADPFGYRWTIAQKVSSPTQEEMAEEMKKFTEP